MSLRLWRRLNLEKPYSCARTCGWTRHRASSANTPSRMIELWQIRLTLILNSYTSPGLSVWAVI